MLKNKILFIIFFISHVLAFADSPTNEPIDVVIPSTEKDLLTLNLCIEGIRLNGTNVRRIIVISEKPLTDQAEWFDEALFPFSKSDISKLLTEKGFLLTKAYTLRLYPRTGWYYQQLLKFYAHFVIPDLSENVLMLDSDTIFLRPVDFLGPNNRGLYCPSREFNGAYFLHAKKFLPCLNRAFSNYSGVAHHMLFQKPLLTTLFEKVEAHHKTPLWKAFCRCVSPSSLNGAGASEYEIYFNFIFSEQNNVEIRPLKWKNVKTIDNLSEWKDKGFYYVSCHSWERINE